MPTVQKYEPHSSRLKPEETRAADVDRISTLEANDGTIRDKLYGGLEIRFPGTTLPVESFSISNASVTFDGRGDGILNIPGTGSK